MQDGTRKAAVFVCTPEIVRTWLLYPVWLFSPGVYPKRIVIDHRDYARMTDRGRSRTKGASPYDTSTWLRLREFGESIDNSLAYGDHVNPTKNTRTAHEVLKSCLSRGLLSKDSLAHYMEESFNHWLVFGLEQKKKLLSGDRVHEEAMRRTQAEYADIQRGNMPFAPELLLERHLAKLLAGLSVRKEVMRKCPHDRAVVFDTGEFEFAARLLSNYYGLQYEETFAIATDLDGSLVDDIREDVRRMASLELSDSVASPHVEEILRVIEAFQRQRDRGKGIEDLVREGEEVFESMRKDADECISHIKIHGRKMLGPSAGALTAMEAVGNVLGLGQDASSQLCLPPLAVLFAWDIFNASECVELVRSLPAVARLKLRLYVERISAGKDQVWQRLLQALWKVGWPKMAVFEEEDIRKQMMAPWVTNPVWFHDAAGRWQ